MFTSKIRAAASRLGVSIAFVRSSPAALADMRANAPALVILDLDNARMDPLYVNEADLHIQGVVIGVMRRY